MHLRTRSTGTYDTLTMSQLTTLLKTVLVCSRAKSEEKANRQQSKYLIFPKNEFSAEALKPSGELKGCINAAILGKTILITTMNGDSLELQVPAKSVNDWEKVLKVMA